MGENFEKIMEIKKTFRAVKFHIFFDFLGRNLFFMNFHLSAAKNKHRTSDTKVFAGRNRTASHFCTRQHDNTVAKLWLVEMFLRICLMLNKRVCVPHTGIFVDTLGVTCNGPITLRLFHRLHLVQLFLLFFKIPIYITSQYELWKNSWGEVRGMEVMNCFTEKFRPPVPIEGMYMIRKGRAMVLMHNELINGINSLIPCAMVLMSPLKKAYV